MSRFRSALPVILVVSAGPAGAQLVVTPEAIEAANYIAGDLPDDPSPLTAKLQILLDRAGISPGVIDGRKGGMSESAIRAFEARQGLPVDGVIDAVVWDALGGPYSPSVLQLHTITPEDMANIVSSLPEDYAQLAAMDWLGYRRTSEMLAERFHMDEDFLLSMNPSARFVAGETIVAADPGAFTGGSVARVEVRKGESRLAAFDDFGQMLANYPVTIGSSFTPSPEGLVEVTAIAHLPTYHYDPENFVQGENTDPLVLPPGPNGPVGSVWIDLSKPTYGLHGTPEPSVLFQRASHGCVRLTNWDAEELASLVREGTVVEFVE
ncbi:murein L,D-transpeptidase [Rubellimicrobium rubrum]|uniref:Murein L,D-transpeptidase n=1 Tax=Rubellimicrobium rubrum TaxID=2585369 RepID=A0A5C4N2U2_9RHOB|nr:L,D-transpeptidase [Rubellimicrobium rubrum]TNC50798.1 murein L,D-transpeptidase [Rubellimicrobium rubrum]